MSFCVFLIIAPPDHRVSGKVTLNYSHCTLFAMSGFKNTVYVFVKFKAQIRFESGYFI